MVGLRSPTRGATGRKSSEDEALLGGSGVMTKLTLQLCAEVHEVVSSTVGCQGQTAPHVVLLLVGEHPAARCYAQVTAAAARATGVQLLIEELPESTQEEELEARLLRINHDEAVHGVVLQLPLPPHLNGHRLLCCIGAGKDIDGIKEANVHRYLRCGDPLLAPCIAVACEEILRALQVVPRRKASSAQVLLLGLPQVLVMPFEVALTAAGFSVSCCGAETSEARAQLGSADVLVVGVRRPDLVAAQNVRPGCVILDVGLSSCAAPTPQPAAAEELAGAPGAIEPAPLLRTTSTDVKVLCCSDGLAAMTAALRMRNGSHLALLQQGFLDCRPDSLLDFGADVDCGTAVGGQLVVDAASTGQTTMGSRAFSL